MVGHVEAVIGQLLVLEEDFPNEVAHRQVLKFAHHVIIVVFKNFGHGPLWSLGLGRIPGPQDLYLNLVAVQGVGCVVRIDVNIRQIIIISDKAKALRIGVEDPHDFFLLGNQLKFALIRDFYQAFPL